MIHIYFKTIEGKLYTVLMNPKYTLKQLIEVVIETTGIAKEELRMVYKQRQLMEVEETKIVENIGIEDHSVIYVVKRMKKCSCESNSCVQNDKKQSTD
jgi:hypothetical protein